MSWSTRLEHGPAHKMASGVLYPLGYQPTPPLPWHVSHTSPIIQFVLPDGSAHLVPELDLVMSAYTWRLPAPLYKNRANTFSFYIAHTSYIASPTLALLQQEQLALLPNLESLHPVSPSFFSSVLNPHYSIIVAVIFFLNQFALVHLLLIKFLGVSPVLSQDQLHGMFWCCIG